MAQPQRPDQQYARAALQRYQLHGVQETGEELGRGSYAAVLAVDYKGVRCAAKKMYSIITQRGEGDRLVTRFEEECRLLGALRHPHIVQFLGIYFEHATDLPVLVMELLPTTLAQCIKQYGRLSTEICYSILHDVALGVRYLHEQRPRVVHRDLSANNVLLTGDMAAKISDLGVAKILHINPAEMSHMTQTPGTQSYMPPEALRTNPRYDIEVDVFSFGVMVVHVLSGQWPVPTESTQVNLHNPANVIGLSEVERRAEYLNVIGRPSEDEEGHPLMPLIERCLSNSPNLRPNASELVEAMSDAVAQQPLSFSNRIEMMQRINSIQREKETLQTQVLELERQIERTEVVQRELREHTRRQETGLTVEVEQLRLKVDNLEAEKTHIITTSSAREEVHHIMEQIRDRQHQEELMEQQQKIEVKDKHYQDDLAAKEMQYLEMLAAKERQNQKTLTALERQYQEDITANKRQYHKNLAAKERQCQEELSEKQKQLQIKEKVLKVRDDQLQVKTTELSSQATLITQQRSTIDGLHSQLWKVRQHLMLNTQVHVFSPNTRLVWRECASIPVRMALAKTAVIDGMVYLGGGKPGKQDKIYHVCKYDPVKNEWSILPPTPVTMFGVGKLNGKLLIVGGMSKKVEVRVFDEDTQRWIESIPPMPSGLVSSLVVTHKTSLIVCGITDVSSPPSMFIYCHQSSEWHSRTPPPLSFTTAFSSAVIVNGTYYLAVGAECVTEAYSRPSSAAVFSQPLSTLLDPTIPSTWQRMPDMPCHTSHLAVTGGCLLALGGLQNACNFLDIAAVEANLTTAVYAYCPATSSWVKIGDLPDKRVVSTITTLSTGELFLAGGILSRKEQNRPCKSLQVFLGNIII